MFCKFVFCFVSYTGVHVHTQVHTYILLKDVQLLSIASWFCSSSACTPWSQYFFLRQKCMENSVFCHRTWRPCKEVLLLENCTKPRAESPARAEGRWVMGVEQSEVRQGVELPASRPARTAVQGLRGFYIHNLWVCVWRYGVRYLSLGDLQVQSSACLFK